MVEGRHVWGRGFAALIAAGMLVCGAPALSQDQYGLPDHEDALKARTRGEIKSLEQILAILKVQKRDRLVDVDIGKRDGLWIYEVTWITSSGRYRIFTVDAASAVVLKDELK